MLHLDFGVRVGECGEGNLMKVEYGVLHVGRNNPLPL